MKPNPIPILLLAGLFGCQAQPSSRDHEAAAPPAHATAVRAPVAARPTVAAAPAQAVAAPAQGAAAPAQVAAAPAQPAVATTEPAATPAQSSPPAAQPSSASPDEQVAAIEKEFDDAQKALFAELSKLKTDEEKSEYYGSHRVDTLALAKRMQAIADAHPRTDAEARALAWILSHEMGSDLAGPALDRLVANHPGSDVLARVVMRLEQRRGAETDALLDRLAEDSPSPAVRGAALYVAAKRAAEPRWSGSQRKPEQAEALLERVVSEYGDVEIGKRKLGNLARGDLFEMRELAIGKVAPDIEGEDLDGVAFKLSDYRGKVVVLDFWGNW